MDSFVPMYEDIFEDDDDDDDSYYAYGYGCDEESSVQWEQNPEPLEPNVSLQRDMLDNADKEDENTETMDTAAFAARGRSSSSSSSLESPSKRPRLPEKEPCAICLQAKLTPTSLSGCSHEFCWTCIQQWGQRHQNTCPLCKKRFFFSQIRSIPQEQETSRHESASRLESSTRNVPQEPLRTLIVPRLDQTYSPLGVEEDDDDENEDDNDDGAWVSRKTASTSNPGGVPSMTTRKGSPPIL